VADNLLWYGDNLDVLREMPEACVDLVYLDPPFNSKRSYNVLFHSKSGAESAAQIQAFDDTWHWSPQAEAQLDQLADGDAPYLVAEALNALRRLLGPGDMMAYLIMMAPRLVELRRVLKRSGCLYLHCDPTASHYLKLLLDSIFGPANFCNEIIWKRHNSRSTDQRWPRIHDTLLFYSKTRDFKFVQAQVPGDLAKIPHTLIIGGDGQKYQTYELTGAGVTKEGESGKPWRGFDPSTFGRHWAHSLNQREELDAAGLIHWPKPGSRGGFPRRRDPEPFQPEARVVTVGDVWTDIDRINQTAKERLGYPTQKPEALLARIITAATNVGDVVLDPFCGCGTSIDAAQRLDRRWVGIDVTYIAVDLIQKRLRHRYGAAIQDQYSVRGIPTDLEGAHALFRDNHFDFERWAVSIIDAQPNERQTGDKGIDGRVRFHVDRNKIGQALVSVKGGQNLNPGMVRDLVGTVNRERAEMGIFLSLWKLTRGMHEEAARASTYTTPLTGQSYPRVQLMTVEELLNGRRPKMPPAILPYIKADQWGGEQLSLLH
jgi:DNA modification methylase